MFAGYPVLFCQRIASRCNRSLLSPALVYITAAANIKHHHVYHHHGTLLTIRLYSKFLSGDNRPIAYNMHNNMITSASGDQDDQLVHDASYSNSPWVGMHSYNHMPLANYQEEYYGMQHMTHGLPSESLGGHLAPSPFTQNIQPNNYPSHLRGRWKPLLPPTTSPNMPVFGSGENVNCEVEAGLKALPENVELGGSVMILLREVVLCACGCLYPLLAKLTLNADGLSLSSALPLVAEDTRGDP